MKTIAVLFAIFLSTAALAQENSTGKITVEVTNVQGDEGKVMFALYTQDSFMKTEPGYSRIGEIKEGKATVEFTDIPADTYGIICYHDKNNNDQIDFGSNGIPVESYGVSNNPYAFGPPQWEEAKFEFDGKERQIEIRF